MDEKTMDEKTHREFREILDERIQELSQIHQGTDDDAIWEILLSKMWIYDEDSPTVKTILLTLYPVNGPDMLQYVRDAINRKQ